MKKNIIFLFALFSMCVFNSCTEECDCEVDNNGNIECPCDGNPLTLGEVEMD